MHFPANQMMRYFYVLISLFAWLLTVLIVSHQEHTHYCLAGQVSSYVGCVPLQLNYRQNVEICGHHIESSLGLPVHFSVHSTTIITNVLINQAGSYYAIIKLYLIWDKSLLYPITRMISLLLYTLNLGSASVSCNDNNIILVIGYN